MARKRISLQTLQKLEQQITALPDKVTGAVFGVCDMQQRVIKKLRMTADSVEDVTDTDQEPEHLIPERLEKLLYPKSYKIVFGGRGSGKTRTVTTILTQVSRLRPGRIPCFREILQSIDDSSYREIVDEVQRKALGGEFKVTDKYIMHRRTKTIFRFKGLYRNLTTIKGFAGASHGWVDESEALSQVSLDYLEPTILRKPGAELWFTFNPNKETDPMWKMVAPHYDQMVDGIYEDDDMLIIECNYSDNPWLTDELKLSRDRMKAVDHDRYMWIWEGKFNKRNDEIILAGKYKSEFFEVNPEWDGPYLGADWGFSTDPTALTASYIEWLPDGGKRLLIRHEAGGVGIELNNLDRLFESVPGATGYRWRADNARPETISHVKRMGFDIIAAKKWAGSIEDGIAYLRGFDEIIIHPDCTRVLHEFGAYSYKVDKLTGDILPDIVDKDNHFIDSLRYAHEPMISQKSAGWL